MFAWDIRYIQLSSISGVHLGQKFILPLSVLSVLNKDPPPSSSSSIKAKRSPQGSVLFIMCVSPHCLEGAQDMQD